MVVCLSSELHEHAQYISATPKMGKLLPPPAILVKDNGMEGKEGTHTSLCHHPQHSQTPGDFRKVFPKLLCDFQF